MTQKGEMGRLLAFAALAALLCTAAAAPAAKSYSFCDKAQPPAYSEPGAWASKPTGAARKL